MLKPGWLLLLAASSLSACQSITSGAETRTGVIDSPYLRTAALVAPDSVNAGTPFTVTVTTLGYSGCWQAVGVREEYFASGVTLVPVDQIHDGACTGMLSELPRSASLRLDQPGTATLRVDGLKEVAGGGFVTTRLERSIVVR
jgi:hypothetical protein